MLRLIAERTKESEPGFGPKTVRWAVWLDQQGRLIDVVPLGDEENARNRGQVFPKCPDQTQGELIARGEIRSHFLVETTEVVALFVTTGEIGAKLRAKHDYFVDLLHDAGEVVPELAVIAGALGDDEFLGSLRERLAQLKAKPTDKVTFRVGDTFVVESTTWHQWWRTRRAASETGSERIETAQQLMRCFVTGELVRPARTHGKIRGLAGWGGQASGDALVCFDKEAFCSYGLEQSTNAAVSQEAMTAYVDGLNAMLRDSALSLAGTRIVYWFDKTIPPEDDPLPWLMNTGREEIDARATATALLDSLRTGKRAYLEGSHYYILLLSGMSGRVMVRDWEFGQFDQLADSICRWFDDLDITPLGGGLPASHGMEQVVTALLSRRLPSQKYEDWIRPIGAQRVALWRAAVRGDQVAFSTLARLVVLCRGTLTSGLGGADRRDSNRVPPSTLRVRMGLMKAYHLRAARWKGDESLANQLLPTLNEAHPSAAYQCGRLLAVLAQVQLRALGDVGAGIVERYYASASSTPALVLGRLTRTSQFHLNKLEPGLARWWEDRIAAIWSRLGDDVPQTLTLEEQSLFALGYYQQLASLRTRRENSDETTKEER